MEREGGGVLVRFFPILPRWMRIVCAASSFDSPVVQKFVSIYKKLSTIPKNPEVMFEIRKYLDERQNEFNELKQRIAFVRVCSFCGVDSQLGPSGDHFLVGSLSLYKYRGDSFGAHKIVVE